jgi:hypothetical protein
MNSTACFAQFFYRVNPNKTIEAICGHCFSSSESSTDKGALQTWETAHRCAHWLKQSA